MPSAKTLLDDYASARNAILGHCGVSGGFIEKDITARNREYWSAGNGKLFMNRDISRVPTDTSLDHKWIYRDETTGVFRGKELTIVYIVGNYTAANIGYILLNENEVK